MKHFVFMGKESPDRIVEEEFRISYFDPTRFLSFSEFLWTSNVDELWRREKKRQKDSDQYHRMLDNFVRRFRDVDVVVANWFNPFHPEWLWRTFPRAIKSEREKIARAGFERVCRDYDRGKRQRDFLRWAAGAQLRIRNQEL